MTFALWMILVAALLPYVTVGAAKFGGGGSGYDNAAPRQWTEGLHGWRQRLEWAHRNHFEALPLFAAAVLVSHLANAPRGAADALAAGFIVFRLAYTGAYAADKATLRSGLWAGALLCCIGLFVLSSFGGR